MESMLNVGQYKVREWKTHGEGTDVFLEPVREFSRVYFFHKRKHVPDDVCDGIRLRLPQGMTVEIGDCFDFVMRKV
jgi:hypothetical protein